MSCRRVDFLRRCCGRPTAQTCSSSCWSSFTGLFEKALLSSRPCESYIFNRLATEGSCRKRKRRFWSLGVIVGRLVVDVDGSLDSSLDESESEVGSGTDFGRPLLVGVTKLGIALGNSVREITVRSCTLTV
jgi:hypothetical protein